MRSDSNKAPKLAPCISDSEGFLRGYFSAIGAQTWSARPHLLFLACLLAVGSLFAFVPLNAAHAQGGTNTFQVGASDSDAQALPNTGVRATIEVASSVASSIPDGGVNGEGLWFYTSEALSNNMWGQVGWNIAQGDTTGYAFCQVWNIATSTLYVNACPNRIPVSDGSHVFAIQLASGTTWQFTVDGSVISNYDMGAASSDSAGGYPINTLSEESQDSSPFAFTPQVNFPIAIQVLKSGAWQNASYGVSYGSGGGACVAPCSTAWGLAGVD